MVLQLGLEGYTVLWGMGLDGILGKGTEYKNVAL